MELTKESLSKLSTEELKELREKLKKEARVDFLTQMALKILINSLYGALANKFFVLANSSFAAAITSSGRFFIRLVADNVERKLQELLPQPKPYVTYGDTDSVYYHIEPFVTKKFGENPTASLDEIVDWCDEFEKKIIQRIISDTIDEYAEKLNVFKKESIGVEREIIADSAVFVAKKKYYARVSDKEGVRYNTQHPYIKVMGLEIVKGSTPPWVKDKLKDAIAVILERDQRGVKQWRDEMKSEFQKQSVTDICMQMGVSNIDYNLNDKGVPQGARSAIIHNNFVKSNGLEGEIELLKPGEKYKRCYLKTPNRFGGEIISFSGDKIAQMIEEDGVYDYSKNFELMFEAPLERMVETLNYNIKDEPVLTDW